MEIEISLSLFVFGFYIFRKEKKKMETGRVLKLLAQGVGAVVLTAFTVFVQEEFAKGLLDSMKK